MDPITAFIINLVIAVVLNVAATLIAKSQQEERPGSPEPGVQGTTSTGVKPATFIIGQYATAGHLIYPLSTWTGSGTDATPNEFLVHVIGVSMLPVRGLDSVIVNGETVTLLTGEEHANRGYPVSEYRDSDNVDHMWVKFYDGTQTSVDSYLNNKFGSHADRPWRTTAVGYGVAYVIVTSRANREFFPSFPKFKFVIDGYSLTDPRGDGVQDNPMVAAHTLMSGISYSSQWFYGPQDIDSNMLPAGAGESWETAMDVCDENVSKKAGGTTARYTCGMEISVDEPLIDVLNHLFKACNGRITYTAGKYKVLVDAPGSSVKSFTDDDIVASFDEEFDQFPGMQEIHNGIRAQYVEPNESWALKDAPPRLDSDYKAADDNRDLIHSVTYRAVTNNRQAQRLMKATLKDSRRFRRHVITVGPEFFEYEPLDTLSWTSSRNGYSAKDFLIIAQEDLPNGLQVLGLHEINPNDYDWTPNDDELDFTFTVTSQSRPTQQTASGFSFAPGTIEKEDGSGWRPTIKVTASAGLADILAIEVQSQINTGSDSWGSKSTFWLKYDKSESAPYEFLLDGTFKPDVLYRARARYLVRGKRKDSEWSAWAEVTTPDLKFTSDDFFPASIDLDALDTSIQNTINALDQDYDDLDTFAANLPKSPSVTNFSDMLDYLYSGSGNNYAITALARKTYVDANFATASQLNTVQTRANDATASAQFKMESSAGYTDDDNITWARIALRVRADNDDDTDYLSALAYWEVSQAEGLSRAVFIQDQFVIASSRWKNADKYLLIADGKLNEVFIPFLTVQHLDVKGIIENGKILVNGNVKLSDLKERINHTVIAKNGIRTQNLESEIIEARHVKTRVFDADVFRTDGITEYFEAIDKNKNENYKIVYRKKRGAKTKTSENGAQFIKVTGRIKYRFRTDGFFSNTSGTNVYGIRVILHVREKKKNRKWRRIYRDEWQHTYVKGNSNINALADKFEQEQIFSFNHYTGFGNVRWDLPNGGNKRPVKWEIRFWVFNVSDHKQSRLELDYQRSELVIEASHPKAKRTKRRS